MSGGRPSFTVHQNVYMGNHFDASAGTRIVDSGLDTKLLKQKLMIAEYLMKIEADK